MSCYVCVYAYKLSRKYEVLRAHLCVCCADTVLRTETGVAIYHLASKHVTRSTGRSAVAAAAYRAGDTLTNEREGRTFDFSNRKGIAHAEIVLPAGSEATWALNRSALWNAAEAAENRKD